MVKIHPHIAEEFFLVISIYIPGIYIYNIWTYLTLNIYTEFQKIGKWKWKSLFWKLENCEKLLGGTGRKQKQNQDYLVKFNFMLKHARDRMVEFVGGWKQIESGKWVEFQI